MQRKEYSKKLDNIKFIFCEKYSKIKPFIILLGLIFIFVHLFILIFPFNHSIIKIEKYNTNFLLELIALAISIPLFLQKFWPKCISWFKPFYWILSITYLLPFWSFWMLLMNQDFFIWQITLFVASVLLIFLIPYIFIFPATLIGYFVAYILFLYVEPNAFIKQDLLTIICAEIFIIAYFIYFEKTRERVIENQHKLLKSLGGSIAHELRTPLASIILGIKGLKNNLSLLFNGYELALSNSLLPNGIDKIHLETLKESHNSLERSANEALRAIDLFLLRMKGAEKVKMEKFSIASIIKLAIDEYPFVQDEIKLIHLNLDNDFIFSGNDILIKYIIFNLIRNSLYSININKKGYISIKSECLNETKVIRFKDNAHGIPLKIQNAIFENFYSNKNSGYGLGLIFCRLAMEEMSGNIECNSKEGVYTEFILKFK